MRAINGALIFGFMMLSFAGHEVLASKPKKEKYISMTQKEYALYELKKKKHAEANRKRRIQKIDFSEDLRVSENQAPRHSTQNSTYETVETSTSYRSSERPAVLSSAQKSEALEEAEYTAIAEGLDPAPPPGYGRISTRAQSADQDMFAVNLEPIWLLGYGFGAKIDYLINDQFSVGVSGIYIAEHEENQSDEYEAHNWSYYEANVGMNYMLTGATNTSGFYINPAVGYFRSEITDYGYFYLDGEMDSPQFRLTVGYQYVYNDFRFGIGVGGRLFDNSDIVIRDEFDQEIAREDSSRWSGAALDLHIGYIF